MASPPRRSRGRSMIESPSKALASLSLNSPTRPRHSHKTSGLKSSRSTSYLPESNDHSCLASPVKTGAAKSGRNSPTKTPGKQRAGGLGGTGRDVFLGDVNAALASPTRKRRSAQNKQYDRFIPNRNGTSTSGGHSLACSDPGNTNPAASVEDTNSTAELTASLGVDLNRRILAFSREPPPASDEQSALLAQYAKASSKSGSASASTANSAAQRRKATSGPERVLDAPGLVDDYYLNLLDWSSENLVAIALGESVFIWNAESGKVSSLCSLSDNGEDYVSSIKFSDDGSYLALATSTGTIQIYDLQSQSRIRTMTGHVSRIPSLSWSSAILSSGSKDGAIWNSDVRVAQHKVSEMKNHRAEICGLSWRKDIVGGVSGGGQGLLASGGNDNVVNVWDGRNPATPRMTKTNHTAAVKALAWCPWSSSVLASGGGSSDKTIHLWNVTNNARTHSLVTPSQVTSLVFNPHARELLSTHGYPDNQLIIWSHPTLNKIAEIPQAHDTRVLHAALSPDGCTIATASSDENLKFWKVFERRHISTSKSSTLISAKGGLEHEDIGKRGKTGIAIR